MVAVSFIDWQVLHQSLRDAGTSLFRCKALFIDEILPDPVGVSHAGGKLFAAKVLTKNVIANFFRHLIALTTNADHHADRFNARRVGEYGFPFGNRCHIVISFHLTLVLLFDCAESAAVSSKPVTLFPMIIEERFNRVVQRGLIAIHTNHKVAIPSDDLCRNRLQ